MRAVLALDQGSHASRACLFDEAGALRASAQVAVSTHRDGDDRVEQDPQELADSLRAAACRCLADAGSLQVCAAGLATQRSSLLCADRISGRPLSAVLSWQDRRHAAWLDHLRAAEAEVRAITGLPLSPHYGASKMRWCLDELPAVRAAARRGELLLLPLAAWLVARLTDGAPRLDPANASRTLLWDIGTGDWSPRLLQLFDIPRALLPECVPTQGQYGVLSGLPGVPIPLHACTGDQSAVPFFAGSADPASAYLNLGTGAFAQRPLTQRPLAPEPLLGGVLCRDAAGTLYSLEGTVNGAGAALGAWAAAEGADESAAWRELETRADTLPTPLFVNSVGGLGSPWWRSGPPARFVDDDGRDPAGRIGRFAAIVESIVFMLAENLRLMAARGAPLERVQVMGGLSRSDWLCRRLAAASGMPVERVDSEATARGVAALAAPEMARHWPVPPRRRFEPTPIPGMAGRQARLLALLSAG